MQTAQIPPNALLDMAADKMDELRQERDSAKRDLAALQDAYTEVCDMLSDLCMDHGERETIGGGPGWQDRHAANWSRAHELMNPEG